MLPTSRLLSDGTLVTLGPVGPGDRWLFERAIAEMSPRALTERFNSAGFKATGRVLDYLTHVDQRTHIAIGAVVHEGGGVRGIGAARCVRIGPESAELAVTVLDDYQRRGLGKMLVRTVAERAHQEGIARFSAEIISERRDLIHVLTRMGGRVRRVSMGVSEIELPLGPILRAA